jgi:hypothetical protein
VWDVDLLSRERGRGGLTLQVSHHTGVPDFTLTGLHTSADQARHSDLVSYSS